MPNAKIIIFCFNMLNKDQRYFQFEGGVLLFNIGAYMRLKGLIY